MKRLATIFLLLLLNAHKAHSQPVRIALLGSSSAQGYGASDYAHAWAGLYTAYLQGRHAGNTLTNMALGGWTLAQTLVDAGTVPSYDIYAALREHPQGVIISHAGNDESLGTANSVIRGYYQTLWNICAASNVPCWFLTEQPATSETDDVLTNRYINSLWLRTNSIFAGHVIDVYTPLMSPTDPPRVNSSLVAGHPNDAGHEVIFELVTNAPIYDALISKINVDMFGCVGDFKKFTGTITSNSVWIATPYANLPTNSTIGKVIQVQSCFEVGHGYITNWAWLTNKQGYIGYVTGVSNGYVSVSTAMRQSGSVPCGLGSNNETNMNAAEAYAESLGQPKTIISGNSTNGTYLVVSSNLLNAAWRPANYADSSPAIAIHAAGICFSNLNFAMNGSAVARLDATTNFNVFRGYLFIVYCPTVRYTNEISWINCQVDGMAETDPRNAPNLTSEWDPTHGVVLWYDPNFSNTNAVSSTRVEGCIIHDVGGEMLKGAGFSGGTNDHKVTFTNNIVYGGSGSVLNPNFTIDCQSNQGWSVRFLIEEFVGSQTSPNTIAWNRLTNFFGETVAPVRDTRLDPGYVQPWNIHNNLLVTTNSGNSLVSITCPNVNVYSNDCFGPIGTEVKFSGANQSYGNITNISIQWNNWHDGRIAVGDSWGAGNGGGITNVTIAHNTGGYGDFSQHIWVNMSASTNCNILVFSNTPALDPADGCPGSDPEAYTFSVGARGQYIHDLGGNLFSPFLCNFYGNALDVVGITNTISYGNGAHWAVSSAVAGKTALAIECTNLIPDGATIDFTNNSGLNFPIYTTSAGANGGGITLTNFTSQTLTYVAAGNYFTNGAAGLPPDLTPGPATIYLRLRR